jgi:hypothetical protein
VPILLVVILLMAIVPILLVVILLMAIGAYFIGGI